MRSLPPFAVDVPLSPHGGMWASPSRSVRPAGWSDASTVGVLGAASTALGTASSYLNTERQLDAWQESLALQQSYAGAQATASAARNEGAPLMQALREQLLRDAANANSTAQAQQVQAQLDQLTQLEAQMRAAPPPSSPPPSPQIKRAPSGGHTAALVVLGVLLALTAGGAALVWSRRKGTKARR